MGKVYLEISQNGQRIYVTSNEPISLKGVVPGANFNKGRSGGAYWSLPLSLAACRILREHFGDRLEIGPGLWEWARAEVARSQKLRRLADSSDAELLRVPEVAPRLAKAMASRTYQRVGARFIAEGRNVLVADQPGLGKTLEALGGVVESGVAGPYLVIAPKTATTSVWAKEIPRWLDGQHVITVPDGRAERDRILNAFADLAERARQSNLPEIKHALDNTWVVIHPEAARTRVWWRCGECPEETPRRYGKVVLKCDHNPELRRSNRIDHTFPQLFGLEWGAIIVDESDRALLRLSATPTQTRQGMELLRVREDGLRVAMTGTPTRGRPHLMWGQLNWLDEKRTPAFWNWVELFWELESNGYTDYIIGKLRREDELWRSLDGFVIRRTKAEVARDMPPKNPMGSYLNPGDETSPYGVWLPMEGEQRKAYDQMMETTVAELPDGGRVEAVGILAKLMRLKQFASTSGTMEGGVFRPQLPSNKFEFIVQLLDELGYPDSPSTKVVIVSQFTETLELFARELPARLQALSAHPRSPLPDTMTPVLLTGNVSGKKRDAAVESINRPLGEGAHIMFLQTKTGGVAITIDTADVMVFVDETWVPDDQEQAEDRIHRISNPRPVFYYYLRSLGTIDEGIALVNTQRDYANKRLLDGRRGVEYARAVLRQTVEIAGGGVARSDRSGDSARNGGGAQHGGEAGARTPRALGGTPGATSPKDGRGSSSEADRHHPGVTSSARKPGSGKMSRRQGSGYEEEIPMAKKSQSAPEEETETKRGRQRKIVETETGERDYSAYKHQPPTDLQSRFADWLIEKLDLEFTSGAAEKGFREGVRLAVALRIPFQASPENQAHRAQRAAEREEREEQEEAPKAKAAKVAKAAKKARPAPEPEGDEAVAAAPAKASRPRKAARATRAAF